MPAQDSAEGARSTAKRAAKGTGGCFPERRDGKIVGYVAALPIPGQRPKTFRGKTQKEALAKRKAYEERLARGEVVLGKPQKTQLGLDVVRTVTVAEHIEYWLDNWVKPDLVQGEGDVLVLQGGLSPTTYAKYQYRATKHLVPLLGKLRFDDLDSDVVDAFWDALGKKNVPYTLRWELLVQLRTLINYVLDNRPQATTLRYNPVKGKLKRLPKPEAKKKPAPEAKNIQAILDAARGDEYELIVHVGMQVGLRIANIASLRFSDFGADGVLDVQRRTNRVTGYGVITRRGMKGKKESYVSEKPVDMTYWAPLLKLQRERVLQKFMLSRKTWVGPDPRSEEAYLFPTWYGKPQDPQEIYKRFKAIVARAGLAEYTPHRMRHDFVSIALASGLSNWEVSKLVDHASTQLIDSTYGHANHEQLAIGFRGVSSWIATNVTSEANAATG